jgi:predicted ArsR family transcriptional regulator
MTDESMVDKLDIPLERDVFLRVLIRELSGILQDIVGYEETAGYISLVGQNIGSWINGAYRQALSTSSLTSEQVADVLVDLKSRIQGDFTVTHQDEGKIVLENRKCPFEDKVYDRPSMCMMTSNVFGVIAAENLGYAKVVLEKTIAQGDDGCKVIVYLRESPESEKVKGREYYRSAYDND